MKLFQKKLKSPVENNGTFAFKREGILSDLTRFYQILTRCSGGKYNESFGVTWKAV